MHQGCVAVSCDAPDACPLNGRTCVPQNNQCMTTPCPQFACVEGSGPECADFPSSDVSAATGGMTSSCATAVAALAGGGMNCDSSLQGGVTLRSVCCATCAEQDEKADAPGDSGMTPPTMWSGDGGMPTPGSGSGSTPTWAGDGGMTPTWSGGGATPTTSGDGGGRAMGTRTPGDARVKGGWVPGARGS